MEVSVCVCLSVHHCECCYVPRSQDYGHNFDNDTVKWANDTIIEWYYISPFSEYVSAAFVLLSVVTSLFPSLSPPLSLSSSLSPSPFPI